MRDAEPEQPSAPPTAPPDNTADDGLHVSSLRPTADGFSMRRLLNRVSVALAGVLLLALALHWLPGVLPSQPPARPTPTSGFSFSALPPTRGSGWKPIGPDWAQNIAFTSNGTLGYVCGGFPAKPPTLFGVYDVHQQSWRTLPTPATSESCRVSVSPIDPADVVLIADSCFGSKCNGRIPVSRAYRSHDGGATWSLLDLPEGLLVSDIAWTTTRFYLSGAIYTATLAPSSVLYAFDPDGSFITMDARQLVGHATPLSYIGLVSNGASLYASVSGLSCSSYCTTLVRTRNDGRDWTQIPSTYRGNPLEIVAAQPNTTVLIGRTFQPDSGITTLLRSTDSGMHWTPLPAFPVNPSTGGAIPFALPDGSIYSFNFGDGIGVYLLRNGATSWAEVAPMSTGVPLAVQCDAGGHAVALWGQAINPTSTLGLEYYPLAPNTASAP